MTTQTKTTFARLEAQRFNTMADRMLDQIGVTSVGTLDFVSLEQRLSAEDAIWTALKLRVESVYAREQAKAAQAILKAGR